VPSGDPGSSPGRPTCLRAISTSYHRRLPRRRTDRRSVRPNPGRQFRPSHDSA
jgi:hypothetical protein